MHDQRDTLDLSNLKLSSLPIEPDDLPNVQKLFLVGTTLERLSTAWANKIQDLEALSDKIQSVENKIEWADALGADPTKKPAAMHHNWRLGVALTKASDTDRERAGCKNAVWRLSRALTHGLLLRGGLFNSASVVPSIAQDLLHATPGDLKFLDIHGVQIPRSDIESLASGRTPPAPEEIEKLEELFENIQGG